MNGLALCAGIAGLELGLHIAHTDYRTVCFVEREVTAAAALVARMEEPGLLAPAPVWDDIATFDGRCFRGLVDIVTAGYPCQPFSAAGRRQGVADPRHLWPEVARIVGEVQPEWVFIENVARHATDGFSVVVADFEGMGYRVAAGLFSAREVGARHQRLRLFGLAHHDRHRRPRTSVHARSRAEGRGAADAGRPGVDVADNHECGCPSVRPDAQRVARSHGCGDGLAELADACGKGFPHAELGRKSGEAERGLCQGAATDELCDALLAGAGRRGELRQLPIFAPGPSEFDAWERLLRHDPTLEPSLRRDADGVATRVERLHSCGNGVVPLAAARAYSLLRAAHGYPLMDFEGALRGV